MVAGGPGPQKFVNGRPVVYLAPDGTVGNVKQAPKDPEVERIENLIKKLREEELEIEDEEEEERREAEEKEKSREREKRSLSREREIRETIREKEKEEKKEEDRFWGKRRRRREEIGKRGIKDAWHASPEPEPETEEEVEESTDSEGERKKAKELKKAKKKEKRKAKKKKKKKKEKDDDDSDEDGEKKMEVDGGVDKFAKTELTNGVKESSEDKDEGEKEKKKNKKEKKNKKSKKSKKKKKKADSDDSDDDDDDSSGEEGWEEKRKPRGLVDEDGVEAVGPVPLVDMDDLDVSNVRSDYGRALLPGEGAAMAAYVQDGKRIPRRGMHSFRFVGLSSGFIYCSCSPVYLFLLSLLFHPVSFSSSSSTSPSSRLFSLISAHFLPYANR